MSWGKFFIRSLHVVARADTYIFEEPFPWPQRKRINKNGGGYSDLSFWVLFQFEGVKSEEPQIKDVVPVD